MKKILFPLILSLLCCKSMAQMELVKEFYADTVNGFDYFSTPFTWKNKLIFQSYTIETGYEPFITDGTQAGTHLLKDISPGSTGSSGIYDAVLSEDHFFFTVNGNPDKIYKSDGTEAGTQILYTAKESENISSPMAYLNGYLFFNYNNKEEVEGIGILSAKDPSKIQMADFRLETADFSPRNFIAKGGYVYFTFIDAKRYGKLCRTDVSGNVTVLDSISYLQYFDLKKLISHGDKLYLWARVNGADRIIVLDESTGKLKQVALKGSVTSLTHVKNLMMYKSDLYFNAYDSGNSGIYSIAPGADSATAITTEKIFYNQMTSSGDTIFVVSRDVLYTLNKNNLSYKLNMKYKLGYTGSPGTVYSLNNKLFFKATIPNKGYKFIVSDGSIKGTFVLDGSSADAYTEPNEAIVFKNQLIFKGLSPEKISRIYKTDGTMEGTKQAFKVNFSNGSADVNYFTQAGDNLFFGARTVKDGYQLWQTDGTLAGTKMSKAPTKVGGMYYNNTIDKFISAFGTKVYLRGNGNSFWQSDGTEKGTFSVSGVYFPSSIKTVGNQIYLRGSLSLFSDDSGIELVKSDGTASGTIMVKDIYPGRPGSYPSQFTGYKGKVYFSADDGVNGRELWVTDGTEPGTKMLKDIYPGSNDSDVEHLIEHKGILYFSAAKNSYRNELWRTDGTEKGTYLVRDIGVGLFGWVASLGEHLILAAHNNTYGSELWISNGTYDSTLLLKDIFPGKEPSMGSEHMIFNKKLLFTATDGQHGEELWVTDGTKDGTVMIKDLYPGQEGSFPSNFTELNGKVYFLATSEAGNELWVTDGTLCGTYQVAELVTGPRDGGITSMTAFKGYLWIYGGNNKIGQELYRYKPTNLRLAELTDTLYCGGEKLSINFSVDSIYKKEGIYQLQMSDSVGVFDNDSFLSTTAAAKSGNFSFTVPKANGTYRMRIKVSEPNIYSNEICMPIKVGGPEVKIGPYDPLCIGNGKVKLDFASPPGGIYYGRGVNNNIIDPALSGPGLFDIKYVFIAANGCSDSSTTSFLVGQSYDLKSDTTICNNDTLWIGNNWYTNEGTYKDTLVSIAGCDSIVQLKLIKTNPPRSTPFLSLQNKELVSTITGTAKWFLNGSEIIGATKPDYTPLQNGSYIVVETIGGCYSDSSNSVYYGLVPIIPATEEGSNLYPNPFLSTIQVEASKDGTEAILFEAAGKQLKHFTLKEGKNILNMSDLGVGVYILKINSNHYRIVKQE